MICYHYVNLSNRAVYGRKARIQFNKEIFNFGFSSPREGIIKIPKTGYYNIVVGPHKSLTSKDKQIELSKNNSKIANVMFTYPLNMVIQCDADDAITVNCVKDYVLNPSLRCTAEDDCSIYIHLLF